MMKVRGKKQREATLWDFIKFINEETVFVNDPLFSKEAIEQYNEKRSSRQENTKKRIGTFFTIRRKMTSVVYKRLKCHLMHAEKVIIWIPVNIS